MEGGGASPRGLRRGSGETLGPESFSYAESRTVAPRGMVVEGAGADRLSSRSATPAACISGTRVNFACICARSTELLRTPKCTTTFWGGPSWAPRPDPTLFPEPGTAAGSRLASPSGLRMGGVRGPSGVRNCHRLKFSLGRAGVADLRLICLCFAGQNLFPTIQIVSEETASWELRGRGEPGGNAPPPAAPLSFGFSVNIIY